MSAAEGFNVCRITGKDGAPLLRRWNVGLELLDLRGRRCLAVATVRAETATAAANICRRMPGGAVVMYIEEAPKS